MAKGGQDFCFQWQPGLEVVAEQQPKGLCLYVHQRSHGKLVQGVDPAKTPCNKLLGD